MNWRPAASGAKLADVTAMFLGPGVKQFCHATSAEEFELWKALHAPQAVAALLSKGYERNTLKRLLNYGIIEYSN